MELNEQQQLAVEQIKKSYEAKQNHVLAGYAGTGKSFLCGYLVKNVYKNPLLCSPTNKASKVLSEFTGREATTLAKVLKLRYEKGALMQCGKPEISGHDVLIIDEASMVGQFYMNLIERDLRGVPILFIGDPEQLPPVKEEHAPLPAFTTKNKSQLTQIVRQAEGNPLIQYSLEIRKNGFSDSKIPYDKINILKFPEGRAVELAVSRYNKGKNHVIAAWRNATVDALNTLIHGQIYDTTSEFCRGEAIVYQKPLLNNKGEILMNNGDTDVIKDIIASRPQDAPFYGKFNCWHIMTESGFDFKVIQQKDKEAFTNAIDKHFEKKQPVMAWLLIDAVADIKHTYAMTCHKLQGSTFDEVSIVTNDLMACYDTKMRRKLAYVAVTRTRNKVAFFV